MTAPPLEVYRIVTRRRAADAMSGEGARLYGGRWNPKGLRVVYTASSRALAMLEMLAQDQPLHARYAVIPVTIPEFVTIERMSSGKLPKNWAAPGPHDAERYGSRRWGRGWPTRRCPRRASGCARR